MFKGLRVLRDVALVRMTSKITDLLGLKAKLVLQIQMETLILVLIVEQGICSCTRVLTPSFSSYRFVVS